MKLTAVEWLFEQVCSEKLSWSKDSMGKLFIDLKTSDILQQAIEMEKEQIREAFINGEVARDRIDSIEYYFETYGR
jgi:hypothetical protein